MRDPFTMVLCMPSGRFKVYAVGKPDDHLMDWLGCNFHRLTVPGQPQRGYERAEDAFDFEKTVVRDELRSYADDRKGTFHGDYGSGGYKDATDPRRES